jgi:GntR family transcriptional regulator
VSLSWTAGKSEKRPVSSHPPFSFYLTIPPYYCINSISTVNIRIDTTDGAAIYLQIVDQIKRSVAVGRLKPEDPLPSVRQLALDLTINPNTVARAYLELEHEGVIYKRQGQGTYVSAQAIEASRRERNRIVGALFERAIVEAVHFGMSAPEIDEVYRLLARRYKLEKP